MTWLPNVNKLFAFGGYRGPFLIDTWLWDPSRAITGTSRRRAVPGHPPCAIPLGCYVYADYDPRRKKAVVATQTCLTVYDPVANTYTSPGTCVPLLSPFNGVVDPANNRVYVFGSWFGGWFNLSNRCLYGTDRGEWLRAADGRLSGTRL